MKAMSHRNACVRHGGFPLAADLAGLRAGVVRELTRYLPGSKHRRLSPPNAVPIEDSCDRPEKS